MTPGKEPSSLDRAALALLVGRRPSKAMASIGGFADVDALGRALERKLGVSAKDLGRLGRSGSYRFAYGGRFHVGETLRYLGRDADNLAERVEGDRYRRYFPVGGRQVLVELTLTHGGCDVRVPGDLAPNDKLDLHRGLRRFLGLEQPLAGFVRALGSHPVMGPLVKDFPGVRVPQVPSLWEALCWAVIGQQINLGFAYRLRNRFIGLGNGLDIIAGEAKNLESNPLKDNHLENKDSDAPGDPSAMILPFPDPEQILSIPTEAWRPAQFSRQKAAYLQGIARAFAEGELSEVNFTGLPDEEAHDALTSFRGIGPWSAAYGLLRALDRMDALPVGDAGLRSALRHHHELDAMPDVREQEALMEPLRPYRGLATYYLWKSLGKLRQE